MAEKSLTDICKLEDCSLFAKKRGFCNKHYKAAWRRSEFNLPQRLCQLKGCDAKHEAKGYCGIHYGRWIANGDPYVTQAWRPQGTPEQRFWERVAITADDTRCWLWLAKTNINDYGCIDVDGERWGTHQYSWFLATGQRSKLCVLHHCDTPRCVNPKHLFEGTNADNVADMMAKGRHPRGEQCSYATLTNNEVLNIKRLLRDGMRVGEVARQVNIDRRHVTAIKRGTIWASVQLEV